MPPAGFDQALLIGIDWVGAPAPRICSSMGGLENTLRFSVFSAGHHGFGFLPHFAAHGLAAFHRFSINRNPGLYSCNPLRPL
jgi:hypothetical protein